MTLTWIAAALLALLVGMALLIRWVRQLLSSQEGTRSHISGTIGSTAHHAESAKDAAYENKALLKRIARKLGIWDA